MRITLVVAAALLCGAAWGQTPEFDMASVQRNPNRGHSAILQAGCWYIYVAVPLRSFIGLAYGLPGRRVIGPDWLDEESYDIATWNATRASPTERQAMLRTLLEERFHLTARRGKRVMAAEGGAEPAELDIVVVEHVDPEPVAT